MKTIISGLLLDTRPIMSVNLGPPEDGELILVGVRGVTALMPYKEDDGKVWIAIVGHRMTPAGTVGGPRGDSEVVLGRLNLDYVGMVHYRDLTELLGE